MSSFGSIEVGRIILEVLDVRFELLERTDQFRSARLVRDAFAEVLFKGVWPRILGGIESGCAQDGSFELAVGSTRLALASAKAWLSTTACAWACNDAMNALSLPVFGIVIGGAAKS